MRIAIDTLFENPYHPTGSVDYLRSVAGTFPAISPQHDYYLLVSKSNFAYFKEFERPNLKFVQCFMSNENMPVRILLQQTLVPYLMRRHSIDVLFSPGNVCPLWGSFCRVLKINTLHQYHTPAQVGRARSVYRKFVFELSSRRSDHVLANTVQTKTEICKFMHLSEDKVTVTGEAFYDIYQQVPDEQVKNILSHYQLRRDYILFVSSLYAYKNTETLIKAFAHVAHRQPSKTQLVIVGRDYDNQLPRLCSLVNELGISESVRFLGFVPTKDIPPLYCGASVFVFPSLIETFGKPLVEAMRCGVPIVASSSSCIPEVLGDAGLLVDPLNVPEMASAIERLIGDESLRRDMIARGLKHTERFSWEAGAKKTLSVIERSFENWKRIHNEPALVRGD
jgi:glycosyltransferase involved in cell wall biosynthesis